MTDPAVHVVVFSKDRPLQLHGYLTSLFEQWHGNFAVSILTRLTDPYAAAYSQVVRECGGPVRFYEEQAFGHDLSRFILAQPGHPLTCFGCDDAVFVRPVDAAALPPLFAHEPDLLGLSLRLGATVKRGMWGQDQPHPAVLRRPVGHGGDLLLWDATAPTSVGDWAYPFDVVGTVYRTEFVRRLVESVAPDNPSRLEEAGSVFWRQHAGGAAHLACYHAPRLVLPTVNVVQSVFPNGTVGDSRLSPAFLLGCWNAGLRLDTWRYANGPQPDSWRVGDFYLRRGAGG